MSPELEGNALTIVTTVALILMVLLSVASVGFMIYISILTWGFR